MMTMTTTIAAMMTGMQIVMMLLLLLLQQVAGFVHPPIDACPASPRFLATPTLSSRRTIRSRTNNKRKSRNNIEFYTAATTISSSSSLITTLSTTSTTATTTTTTSTDDTPDTSSSSSFDWTTEWYPVAPIQDLDPDAPNKITLLGMDFCVWRSTPSSSSSADTDDNTAWQAFADSCPHRAVPLSEGRIERSNKKKSTATSAAAVKGDAVLECAYHGWSFDKTGSCVRIPQLTARSYDDVVKRNNTRACVTTFPVRVEQELLWIFPTANNATLAGSKQPALVPEVDDPDTVDATAMYVRDLPYSVTTLIENLVDPVHVNFAHHSYMRGADRDNGSHILDLKIVQESSRGFRAQKDPPPHAPGRYDVKFEAPCLLKYNIDNSVALGHDEGFEDGSNSFSPVDNKTEDKKKKTKKKSILVLAQYCVPVGPHKCRLITRFPFYLAVKPAMWAMRYTPRWITHFAQNIVLDSDVVFLKAQDEKLKQESLKSGSDGGGKSSSNPTRDNYYMPSKSDAMVVAFHKWLAKYGGNQPTWIGIPATQSDGERMGWVRPQNVAARAGRDDLLDRYRQHTDICTSCRDAHKRLYRLKSLLTSAGIALLAAAATPALMAAKRARLVAAVSSVLLLLAPQFLVQPLIARLECAPWPRKKWL